MSDILAMVPYYGGGDENINCMLRSPIIDRRIFILKTCLNLLEFCNRVVVGVATDEDERHVSGLNKRVEVKRFPNYPMHLPAAVANHVKWGHPPEKYVLYTEADHLFHFRDLQMVLDACDRSHYVLPQRMDECAVDGSHWLQDSELIEIDGRKFSVNNRVLADADAPVVKEHFYSPASRFTAYAGAYMLRRDVLSYIDYPYEFYGLVVERVSGLTLFHTDGLVPLKTRILTDFWIEHLSGRTHNEDVSAGKIKMDAFPDLRADDRK